MVDGVVIPKPSLPYHPSLPSHGEVAALSVEGQVSANRNIVSLAR